MLRKTLLFCIAGLAVLSPLLFAQSTETKVLARKSELDDLVSLLHDYRKALAERDAAYLSAHTAFPMSFSEADFDMEAKAGTRVLTSIDDLLRVAKLVSWPQVLVPDTTERLASLKRGAEKCGDPGHPDIPNWRDGAPAFAEQGDTATLTYLDKPCEAATHMVILEFQRDNAIWKLRRRAIRMGAQ